MISVFIPTYNASAYIRETLDSVLSQSYHDIEVYCVDDGSFDNTVEILKEYARKDSRVKVFEKKNQGSVPYSWNFIFPHLKGEFTFYLSHDDLLAPDLFVRLLSKQKESDADAVIPTVVWFEKDPKTPEEKYLHLNHLNRMAGMMAMSGKEAFDRMLDYKIPGFALWRTDLIREIGMPTESFNSDELMQRIWVSKCRSVEFSGAKFFYRQHPDSITKGLKPYHYGSLLTDMRLLEAMQENGIDSQRIKDLQFSYFRSLFYLQAQYYANRNRYSEEDCEKIENTIHVVYPVITKNLFVPKGNLLYRIAGLTKPTFNLAARFYSLKLKKQ